MRELGFRAWDTKEKRYTDAEIFISNHGKIYRIFWQELEPADDSEIIVELSTGLKDKNGKEIYEGDIVRYAIRPSRTTVVEWWSREEEYYPCCTTSGFALPYSEDGYEVIGNIHENKELLG